jgi:DNA-binding response OmpR family regulator
VNSPSTRGRRILVVEDEYLLASALAEWLELMDMSVVGPAASIADALSLIARENIDFAIVDVNLRGTMSFPVAEALAARGVPFVFASGYGDASLLERFPGAVTCRKPYDLRQLEAAILAAPI